MPKSDKINVYTIYLIKAGVSAFNKIIDIDNVDYTEILVIEKETIGNIFIKKSVAYPPKWVGLFDGAVDKKHFGVTGSPAAAIVISAGNRTFVVTFGQGRYLIRPEVIEDVFGLKTALNSIDETALKSLDKKNFDAISKQSREQASRDVDLREFGIDIERDLLRSVTGTPRDSTLGLRMAGMDSLKLSVRAKVSELPELLKKYIRRIQVIFIRKALIG